MKAWWRPFQILKNHAGMTLIEIMVVLAIIASIGALASVYVLDAIEEADVKTTSIKINRIEEALMQFKRKHGFFPSSDQGLEALVEKPTSGREVKNYPEDGYLEGSQLKDAWDEDFIYYYPGVAGHKYEIVSMGPDGDEGTDDDITSYEKKEKEE